MPTLPLHLEPTPLIEDPPLPRDPKLHAEVEDLISRLKLSFVMASNGTLPRSPKGVDLVNQRFIASRTPQARAKYGQKAKTIVNTEALRRQQFGQHAELSAADYQKLGYAALVEHQAKLEQSAALSKFANSFEQWWINKQKAEAAAQAQAADKAAGAAYKKMRVKVIDVACIEDTSEWGADEIAIGGMIIAPNGDSAPIDDSTVSDDVHSGDDVALHQTFATWNIDTKPDFPHIYGVVVALAERDDGGFWQWIHNLWDEVSPEVKTLVTTGVGAAIGGSVGGVIGAIAGAVIGAIVGFVISAFDNPDDILGTHTVMMTLADDTKSYYDWAKLTATGGWPFHLNYYGDGSHYRVNAAYKIYPN
jgi:hypothetical protein